MKTCRICGWPMVGDKCPWCDAWVDRFAALAAMENAEAIRDDDRAWADYRDEQADRLATVRGVA